MNAPERITSRDTLLAQPAACGSGCEAALPAPNAAQRRVRAAIPYAGERWYQLLHQACEESTVTAVAAKLGYGRARVSQVLNGIVVANATPDRVAAKVIEVLDARHCPYLNTEISAEDCRAMHASETPSHNPAHLAHRRMCRTCQHKGGK